MKRKTVTASVCIILAFALLISFIPKKEKIAHSVFTGMGTVIDIKLYDEDNGESEALSKLFSDIENTSSVRKTDSKAYLLNESGKTDDKMLIEEARICLDVFDKSNGAFDFTLGKISSLWNIGFEGQRVPDKDEIDSALGYIGSEKIKIDDELLALGEGQMIDFGAIAKGYACDKAKDLLEKSDIKNAVISIGGSILFFGEKKGGWQVAVRSPFDEKENYCRFSMESGFVSTSGDYERFFEENGKTYHHIFDPETGYPVNSKLKSVTVIAKSGALSDALPTACFVLGREKSEALLEKYGAEAIFIDENGDISVFGNIDIERIAK